MVDLDLLDLSFDVEEGTEEGTSQQHQPIQRMAIIDGCNVMFGCSKMGFNTIRTPSDSENKEPDAVGLYLMAFQLLAAGFDIRTFVPISYLSGSNTVNNGFILQELQDLGYLTEIDDGSHDDLIILEMAKCVGGFVISNDKFRDHTCVESLKEVIENRVVRFKFEPAVNKKLKSTDYRIYAGLLLTLIPQRFSSMYVVDKEDPTFAMAFSQRMNRDDKKASAALERLSVVSDYLYQEACQIFGLQAPMLPYFNPRKKDLPSHFETFIRWYEYWKANTC